MNNRILRISLSAVIAVTGVAGLAACSSNEESASQTSAANTAETIDVAEDLENARQTVLDTLADDDSWGQVMLASDVDRPTEKYGLLVVPYTYSDASARVQSTITIDDGEFTIDAESAATGQTWRMDQDGTITEVTE